MKILYIKRCTLCKKIMGISLFRKPKEEPNIFFGALKKCNKCYIKQWLGFALNAS